MDLHSVYVLNSGQRGEIYFYVTRCSSSSSSISISIVVVVVIIIVVLLLF